MGHILEVKHLTVSFKSAGGKVQAVRDVSFDLEEGETLCIVGESGSGKSVTAKSMLGILAGNSIVEGGQILYEGRDLLQTTEEEFNEIRGNEITMIFQDPLSSLDPIMRIGKQMTEATLLNGKANCKKARKRFAADTAALRKELVAAGCPAGEVSAALSAFSRAAKAGGVRRKGYENAREYAESAIITLERLAVDLHKDDPALVRKDCRELRDKLGRARDEQFLRRDDPEVAAIETQLRGLERKYEPSARPDLEKLLETCRARLESALAQPSPDFYEGGEGAALAALLERAAPGTGEGRLQALRDTAFRMVDKVTRQAAHDKAIRIMEDVGIKEAEKRFRQYPFEFSGGMRQRIVIAIAIAANPNILICDEPTTALDVTIQAQILELIHEIKRKRKLSVIFITHDLGVVANMADKVAVMYAGKIVEYGTADEVFYQPAHPYTWALLASMPDLDTKEKLDAIPGTPPNMIHPPVGDAFAERNRYAMQIDFERQPPAFPITETHWAATWLLHPDAPKVEPPKTVTDRIRRMQELEAAAHEQ